MSLVVGYICEDHADPLGRKLEVNMVAEFDGFDEDGIAQYAILHGVDPDDVHHEECDLSLERW